VLQAERWRFRHRSPWNGGVLATAGGLIFQGTADGYLLALDAASGRELWRFFCQTGVMAAPVSYEIDGRQYVSVAVGWGGHFGLEWGPLSLAATGGLANHSRVLTFSLGGQASLPDGDRWRAQSEPAVARPRAATPARVQQGRLLFAQHCAACHGGAAISGGVLPDLRNSSEGIFKLWQPIVRGGLLQDRGMASFADHLSESDAEVIRLYVLHRAHQTWTERKAAPKR
jgi:alcohol dehydrogenase (cytochrome c)/quinohemoprotein ethanol dehydrogenase